MPATASTPTTVARRLPATYPRPAAPRVPSDRAASLLEQMLRDALRVVRAACQARPLEASQNFTDAVVKGRAFGARSIGRMLADAKRARCPLDVGLGVAASVEAFVLAIWQEEDPGVGAMLRAETQAQGEADCAQLRVALSGDDASLHAALEESLAHLTTQRRLVAALTRELARRRA